MTTKAELEAQIETMRLEASMLQTEILAERARADQLRKSAAHLNDAARHLLAAHAISLEIMDTG